MIQVVPKYPLAGKVIGVDTEGTGLKVHLGHRIFAYSFANTEGQTHYVEDDAFRWPGMFDTDVGQYLRVEGDTEGATLADKPQPCFANRLAVKRWLEDASIVKVFHNKKHDLKHLGVFGIKPTGICHDVMNLAHLLSCQGPAGLEYDDNCLSRLSLNVLSQKYLPQADWKIGDISDWVFDQKRVREFLKRLGRKPNYSDAPSEDMERYARKDPLITLKLFYMFLPHVRKDRQLWALYQREIELSDYVRNMEMRGTRLNVPYMHERAKDLRAKEVEAHKWLVKHTEAITLIKNKSKVRTFPTDDQNVIKAALATCEYCGTLFAGIDPTDGGVCKFCNGTGVGETIAHVKEAPLTKAGQRRFKATIKKKIPVVIQPEEINFGSDDQLGAVLFEQKGLPVMGRTDTIDPETGLGNPSMDERALSSTGITRPMPIGLLRPTSDEHKGKQLKDLHIDNLMCLAGPGDSTLVKAVRPTEDRPGFVDTFFADPYCAKIVEWRQYEKLRGTYFEGFLERMCPGSDILHGNFAPIGTNSGRFSSSDPNLQNMPMEGSTRERAGAILVHRGVKEMFIPREGYTNWHFDYKGVELRMFAHFANDELITDYMLSGRDFHDEVCKLLFGTVNDMNRVLAKIVSFGILYGMGRDTFAWKLQISKAKVEELLNYYFTTFPGVKKMQQDTINEIRATGTCRNAYGRRYLIHRDAAYRGVNYKCQGSAADALKKAMVRLGRLCKAMGLKSNMLMQIHDELVWEIWHEEERWLVPKIAAIMADQPEISIPLIVDTEKADGNWGNLVKWDIANWCPKKKKGAA